MNIFLNTCMTVVCECVPCVYDWCVYVHVCANVLECMDRCGVDGLFLDACIYICMYVLVSGSSLSVSQGSGT